MLSVSVPSWKPFAEGSRSVCAGEQRPRAVARHNRVLRDPQNHPLASFNSSPSVPKNKTKILPLNQHFVETPWFSSPFRSLRKFHNRLKSVDVNLVYLFWENTWKPGHLNLDPAGKGKGN